MTNGCHSKKNSLKNLCSLTILPPAATVGAASPLFFAPVRAMPTRPRSAALARRLESADQPVYVLDEERWLIAANEACCKWTGLSLEQLLTVRCTYRQERPGRTPDWSAALTPPPQVWEGPCQQGTLVWLDAAGAVRRRTALFSPLTAGGMARGVLVVVGDELAPEDPAQSAATQTLAALDDAHAALARWRATLRGRLALPRLAGVSAAAQRAAQQGAAAAQLPAAAVVIYGPPGSGAEHVARAIVAAQADDPPWRFTPLDAAALDPTELRAILRPAPEKQAAGHAILLRDVDCWPRSLQSELAALAWPDGVRILATAARSLTALATCGEFDPALAQRLCILEVELPALADRPADLPLAAQALIEDLNAVSDKQLAGLTPEALEKLALHRWPGDLEELAETLRGAHERADGRFITLRDLPTRLDQARQAAAHRPSAASPSLQESLETLERTLIEQALARARGNRTKAARQLGLTRPRLYRRMVQLGLAAADDEGPDFEEQR